MSGWVPDGVFRFLSCTGALTHALVNGLLSVAPTLNKAVQPMFHQARPHYCFLCFCLETPLSSWSQIHKRSVPCTRARSFRSFRLEIQVSDAETRCDTRGWLYGAHPHPLYQRQVLFGVHLCFPTTNFRFWRHKARHAKLELVYVYVDTVLICDAISVWVYVCLSVVPLHLDDEQTIGRSNRI